MIDINTILQKAYYDAITAALAADGIEVYEGEEPDDLTDKLYVVLSDIQSSDRSTKSTNDLNVTIQVNVHSWEYKYNNSVTLNECAGKIIEAICPDPDTNFDLSADGLQVLNTKLQTDRTDRLGELSGRKFISRILIFEQHVFIND